MRDRRRWKQIAALAGVFLGAWLGIRYLLPVMLPFLVGLGVAALAEPGVRRITGPGRLPRALGAALCVTGIYLLLGGLVYLAALGAYRELGSLSRSLPRMAASLARPMGRLRDWVYSLTDRAPGELRPMLESTASSLLSGTSALAGRAVTALLGFLSGILSQVPDSMLFLGTAVVASFMISAKMPGLRRSLSQRLPPRWKEGILPALRNLRLALGGWLAAQVKLMGLTFLIVLIGLLVLRVRFAPLFALLIALVDALPMLGTGTVLVPWSLLRFLDGDPAMGVGLLALYGVALTTRSLLEPRLVGKHMGLDPLLTLCALYAGYRLWGVLGMLLAPALTITAMELYTLAKPLKKELQSPGKADMI